MWWRERVWTSEGATALERECMGGECRRDEVPGAGLKKGPGPGWS